MTSIFFTNIKKIGTRQLDMARTKDTIKNMKIKEIKVKQSIFPQLDTDFPSENFHYSRNAAKGAMRCKMEISSH